MARKYISTLKTNIAKENLSLDFVTVKKIDETRSYFLAEIKHNDLMSEKYKKVCIFLNYFEHFLVFVSVVSDCVSISALALFVGAPVGIVSSALGTKIYAITARIKMHKLIIKKKKKKQDKIVLLAKSKLNTMEVLISIALIDSYINYDEFVLVNNVLRE